jgi:glucose-1-phosphate thymidylyltransferase
MNLVVLAAGYATRLYPLTLTQPKSLLPVAGKPMINHVLDHVTPIASIDRVYVVSNAKFSDRFQKWADDYRRANPQLNFTVINDGSMEEADKLGAIGDLHLVLTREQIDDDIVVVAGDNLFNQPLTAFGEFCHSKQSPVLGVFDVGSLDLTKKYSEVRLDESGRIILFAEKPDHPTTTLIGIALYYYPKKILPLIKQYVLEGNNTDQPGRLVQWLYPKVPFYTWTVSGLWYDIGSKETLEEANRIFAQS